MMHRFVHPRPEPPPSAEDLLRPALPRLSPQEMAKLYQPAPATLTAVNVAASVGAPLLVTGEPGVGKTQLAHWLAWYMNNAELLALHVKSTTVAEDLLYDFDTVRYFHDSHDPRFQNQDLDKAKYVTPGPLWQAFNLLSGQNKSAVTRTEPGAGNACPAVVLIDEIDKAPRDFPNDLLRELDEYAFTCKPTGQVVTRPRGVTPPLVVITSNSERRLPAPFLRRCIFHPMKLHSKTVEKAAEQRWKALHHDRSPPPTPAEERADEALRTIALKRFWELREEALRKKPSTAELLTWLDALRLHRRQAADLEGALSTLPLLEALVKDTADLDKLAPG